MRRRGSCRSNATCRGRCSSRRLTSASRARAGCSSFCPTLTRSEQSILVPAARRALFTRRSGGDSTRQAGQVQLRRRLRSGFTASLLYTFSKSIDDDAFLGGQGHVLAGNQTAAPSGGQGQGSGQGSGGDLREPRPPPRKAPRRHRPSRRTGSTCMPSVRFPVSINVTCSTCRPNTPAVKGSAVER